MRSYEIRVTHEEHSIGCRVRVIAFDGFRWNEIVDRECWSSPSLRIALAKAALELETAVVGAGYLDPE